MTTSLFSPTGFLASVSTVSSSFQKGGECHRQSSIRAKFDTYSVDNSMILLAAMPSDGTCKASLAAYSNSMCKPTQAIRLITTQGITLSTTTGLRVLGVLKVPTDVPIVHLCQECQNDCRTHTSIIYVGIRRLVWLTRPLRALLSERVETLSLDSIAIAHNFNFNFYFKTSS